MFTSATRFLVTLTAVFALLLTMWVNAAHAADTCSDRPLEGGYVGENVTVCVGSSTDILTPPAPRGTVRHLPKVNVHQVGYVRGVVYVRARVGVTTVVHMGARS